MSSLYHFLSDVRFPYFTRCFTTRSTTMSRMCSATRYLCAIIVAGAGKKVNVRSWWKSYTNQAKQLSRNRFTFGCIIEEHFVIKYFYERACHVFDHWYNYLIFVHCGWFQSYTNTDGGNDARGMYITWSITNAGVSHDTNFVRVMYLSLCKWSVSKRSNQRECGQASTQNVIVNFCDYELQQRSVGARVTLLDVFTS